MKKSLVLLFMILFLAVPASGLEIEAPEVPKEGRAMMPDNSESFAEGLLQIVKKAAGNLRPDLKEAAKVWTSLLAVVVILSVLDLTGEAVTTITRLGGAVAVALVLLQSTNSMVRLASDTVQQISDYGKLLLPVMAGALAAQGGVAGSGGLYLGTSFFTSLLNSLFSDVFLDGVYLFLVLAVAGSAIGEPVLQKLKDTIKAVLSWSLKTILTVFTTYMSITGVVSGTTDAAALKALKVTISSVVPVVGGILSDASESVLVSAGLLKNAAGIYGIFALLSLFLGPFFRIGLHYLLLKAAAAVSAIFGTGSTVALIGDFSAALGLMLGITGSACLLQLISTVCFLKGVGI